MKLKSVIYWLIAIFFVGVFGCSPKTSKVLNTKDTFTAIPIERSPNIEKKEAVNTEKVFDDYQLKRKIPVDPTFRMGVLENGMRYFIKKNSKPENRVELRLALKAGSIMEDENQRGLAHFIEHMEFNGSEHFTSNQLINYLEKVGTKFGPDLNAYTSFDETVYMLQVRSDEPMQLDTGLLVIYDWAGKAAFDHKEIDKERGVVISEWRTGLSPGQRMMQKTFPVMFKGSRYAKRLPIGDPDIVKNANYETIKKFYKDWYRPNLMAVIVVGDIDVDKMEQKLINMFSDFSNPTKERERKEYKVPTQKGTDIVIVTDKEAPFTNVQVLNKLEHKSLETKSDYLESIKRRLFNMMLNARLDEIKNSANPPFTFAYSGYSSSIGDIDMFQSWAMVPEGKALEALATFAEENQKVLRYGFTSTELAREKTNLLKNAERAKKENDKTESRRFASKAVYHFLKNAPMMNADQHYNFVKYYINKVGLKSINDMAKDWIKEDNRVVIITGPEKEGLIMPTKNEVMQVLNNSKTKTLEAYVDNTVNQPLFSKKLPSAAIVDSKSFDKYGIKKLVLENGLEVYYKKTDFKNDEIRFSAFSPGGTSLYDDADFLNADYASSAVDEMGLADFDVNQLKKLLTGKRVSASPHIGRLYDYFRGNSSVEDLETMFQLINLYFTAPRKDVDAFASFINRNKGLYGNLLKQPDYYFYDVVNKIKYANNMRAGGIPQPEDYDNLDIDRLYEIYKERFANAGDFKFFFVGNFDETKLKSYIQEYLGNLPSTRTIDKWVDRNIEMVKGGINKKIYNGEAPKTFVDITFHGDYKWSADNDFILKSLIKIMNIKLRESLREDKGGVYGVRVNGRGVNEPKETYSIGISFNSEPDKTEELIEAVYTVLDKLKTEGPDEEVMIKIKETQKQSRIKNLKENRYWLNKISSIVQDKLDFSELTLESLEERINKLKPEDIKKAANRYLSKDNLIEISMYPENYKK